MRDPAKKARYTGEFVSLKLHVKATDLLMRRSEVWRQFLDLLCKWKAFMPEKYDLTEPPRLRFDARNISAPLNMLLRPFETVLFERYKPYYEFFMVDTGSINAASPVNFQSMAVDCARFADNERTSTFVTFAVEMWNVFKPLYGCIYHELDWNRQNTIRSMIPIGRDDAKASCEKGFGGDIRRGIPGIYWANFFSQPYVVAIGRERFLSAPCYERTELEDGGFLLLTSASPNEWSNTGIEEERKKLRSYLDDGLFCDIERPDRICRIPELDCSVWEQECDRGMKLPPRLRDVLRTQLASGALLRT